ncbi:hypothetical protein K7X08_004960 [Anisodus acutangulus]|uniref:Uncharacterized protein n=1 Tax=Anisodus acutangulus TaxID=402998 RepID=A0A9Q1RIN2_9SOLA|nr:hypothetical protein K7X08_004960 [Anisodus acutangulus]
MARTKNLEKDNVESKKTNQIVTNFLRKNVSNKRVSKEKKGDIHKKETFEKEKNDDVHEKEEEVVENSVQDEGGDNDDEAEEKNDDNDEAEEEEVDDEEKDEEEEEEENNVYEMAWEYEVMSFVGKTTALYKQRPLPISRILRWQTEDKLEPIDPFRNVRSSRKRIRKALKFANAKKIKVNAFDGSPLSHPDHVDDAHDGPSSPLPNQIVNGSCKTLPLIDLAHVHNDDGSSSPLPDQIKDASCKTLPSNPLHVQVDDASCNTLPVEVVDWVVDSEDQSPNERITDVLA